MIKLTITKGPKNRIIKRLKFVKGVCELPDELYGKAKLVEKFHNVSVEVIKPVTDKETEVQPGDEEESDIGEETLGDENEPNILVP